MKLNIINLEIYLKFIIEYISYKKHILFLYKTFLFIFTIDDIPTIL